MHLPITIAAIEELEAVSIWESNVLNILYTPQKISIEPYKPRFEHGYLDSQS